MEFYIRKVEKLVRFTTAYIINKLTCQDTKYLDMEVFVGAEQLRGQVKKLGSN